MDEPAEFHVDAGRPPAADEVTDALARGDLIVMHGCGGGGGISIPANPLGVQVVRFETAGWGAVSNRQPE